MSIIGSGKEGRFNYGWLIVGITLYSNLIFSGCIYFAFSLFIKPLQVEFGWARSTLMAAFTFTYLTIAFSSPFAGKAMDRYGPKIVMSFGAVVMALGYVSLVWLKTPIHYYLSFMTIGLGATAMGPVCSTAVVSQWFEENRGLAIGVMSIGIGLGGLIIAPLIGGYIIPKMGWKAGYLTIGILTATLIPMVLAFIKTNPQMVDDESENYSDENGTASSQTTIALADWTLRSALPTTAFCFIAGSFMISQFSCTGSIQSQVPHLQDIGFPVATASAALGVLGLVSMFSKLFFRVAL